MDIHQTEEQQVEAIKTFWHNNGNSIIAGLVLGFGGFIGYNFYQDKQYENEINTSEAYQSVLELAEEGGESYRTAGDKFVNEHGESSYASLTAMALAKDAASHKDWAKTADYLKTAIEKSPNAGIKGIATVRLARVQVQLEQYAEAITTLNATLPESFKASAEEIKGDAFLKQGKVELARNAYQAAIDAAGDSANRVLQMKLDDLAQNINL